MKSDDCHWKKLIGKTFAVHVTPKASFERITAEVKENELHLKVYVTAPPEDNKANEAVIRLLAKELRVSKSTLTIIQGFHSRKKIIQVG